MGPEAARYANPAGTAAHEIPLSRFRTILIWPLTVDTNVEPPLGMGIDKDIIHEAMSEVLRSLRRPCSPWRQIDPLDHASADAGLTKADKAYGYSEFVYFHDHVQRTIYAPLDGAKAGAVPPVAVFQRHDISGVKVEIGNDIFKPSVERICLYVYKTGVVALAVELDFGKLAEKPEGKPLSRVKAVKTKPDAKSKAVARLLTLADAQNFINVFRRSYTPYFSSRDWSAADSPASVTWLCSDKAVAGPFEPHKLEACHDMLRNANGRRDVPMFGHWQHVLQPLRVRGASHDGVMRWPVFRQIVDERIPVMSFISVRHANGRDDAAANFHSIRRGDWIRLAFADGPGSAPLPYAPPILDNFETENCYDRFIESPATSEGATRYTFVGYHFATVGADWFTEDIIEEHFRRHYFQMALMAHMEFASLLATSSRITNAVREKFCDGDKTRIAEGFTDDLLAIQQDFLEFSHLFRFTGVSSQLQPGEMYAMWRKSLRLDDIYEDVKDELDTASSHHLGTDNYRQADAATRLNTIATGGLIAGLALSIAGVSALDPGSTLACLVNPGFLQILGASLAGLSGVAAVASWFNKPKSPAGRRLVGTVLASLFIVGLLIFSAGLGFEEKLLDYTQACRVTSK